jgi:hypothetical protein
MANKKSSKKNTLHEKTIMEKISDGAGHLKDELVAGKDHLMDLAGDAITSVKSTIQKFTKKKKAPAKKAPKKVVAKTAKPVVKKVKKSAAAAKKVLPPKKAATRSTKKAVGKK